MTQFTERQGRVIFGVLCFLGLALLSAPAAAEENGAYYQSLQKRLINDGFDAAAIRTLYARPEVKFETKGGERLVLRPEMTASVVRAYLENGLMRQPGTMKFWYMAPMFRHDRPQAGRYRQFHQVGVEAIGSASPVLDAEVIQTLLALFDAVETTLASLRITAGMWRTLEVNRERLPLVLQTVKAVAADAST